MSERIRYYVKVIHIGATDSPSVRCALAQKSIGLPIDTREVEDRCPGVLTYEEYVQRLATWDSVRKCIGLDGKFWEGSEVLMYPPEWLDRAERLNLFLRNRPRIARGMGVDPGEGTANTAIAIVDELGLIELYSEKTLDTSRIIDMVLEKMHQYHLTPERVLFDRGGGGKQHVDRMRANGFNVRSVGFGDKPSIEPQRHKTQYRQKVESKERRYAYFNKRAEMYGELRNLFDPWISDNRRSTENLDARLGTENQSAYEEVAQEYGRIVGDIKGFAIPAEYQHLRAQLAPIPLRFDLERLKLPPKHRKDNDNKREKTLEEIIGHSPDEADALVLAVHAMQTISNTRTIAGAV